MGICKREAIKAKSQKEIRHFSATDKDSETEQEKCNHRKSKRDGKEKNWKDEEEK